MKKKFVVSASSDQLRENGKKFLEVDGKSISGSELFNRGALAPVGLEKMPFVMFRVLPEVAKAIDGKWTLGESGREFENFGFFFDKRKPAWPVPLGFTWTVPDKEDPNQTSYTMRTCASCHVSRIRIKGEIEYLEGAPQKETEFHAFTSAWVDFIGRALAPGAREKTKQIILKTIASKPVGWFYNGQSAISADGDEVLFSEAKAKQQVEILEDNIDSMLKDIYEVNVFRVTVQTGMKNAFSKVERAQPVDIGPRGIADSNSSGIYSIINHYNLEHKDAPFPVDTLFKGATKVAIPSVWGQSKRTAAQWTASVTNIFFRNAIAAMGFGSDAKMLNALHLEIVSRYISDLPAPKFPGTIDQARANIGKRSMMRLNVSLAT